MSSVFRLLFTNRFCPLTVTCRYLHKRIASLHFGQHRRSYIKRRRKGFIHTAILPVSEVAYINFLLSGNAESPAAKGIASALISIIACDIAVFVHSGCGCNSSKAPALGQDFYLKFSKFPFFKYGILLTKAPATC